MNIGDKVKVIGFTSTVPNRFILFIGAIGELTHIWSGCNYPYEVEFSDGTTMLFREDKIEEVL